MLLSNVKNISKNVNFEKGTARDNSMYNINEGNNLEQKEANFIDKMIEMDIIPTDK